MDRQERQSRVIEEDEAARWIQSGMTVALGEPAPMALIRQIVRRELRDLTIVGAGLSLDLLVAAGCVRKVISYYAGGGFGVPVAPSFRRAAEAGEIEVWECEEGILTAGLQAAAQNLPFLPWRGGVGTSLPAINPDLRVMVDPIRGETLLAVPAIAPDVAIVHAAAADAHGNVQHVGGPGWIDLFLCRAADRTIVQVEKVIANEEVRANPWATTLAAADAIVRLPYGAHPFYSRGHYVQDGEFLKTYLGAASSSAKNGDPEDVEAFLRRYCREPQDHVEYLEQIGFKKILALFEY